MKSIAVGALRIAVLLALAACRKPVKYEADVEITRLTSIRKDETGATLTTDAELSYVDCPGTQVEVIRGGRDFSSCMAKYKVGDKVKVRLEHHPNAEGFMSYDVYEVNGCPRPPDPNDEASYKMIRDCADWNVNGARVGFQCQFTNKKELVKKCPWFRVH